jgi:predicted helicase
MACGTGKTMLGAFAAKQMWDSAEEWATKNGMQPVYAPVLVLVPSLSLAAQTVRAWELVFSDVPMRWKTVCSETTTSEYEDVFAGGGGYALNPRYVQADQLIKDSKTVDTLRGSGDSLLQTSTELSAWLMTVATGHRRLVVSTYHSLHHVTEIKNLVWGLVIEDEAHHCASRGGAPTQSKAKRQTIGKRNKKSRRSAIYTPALDGKELRAVRRLALTATPRPEMVGDYINGEYTPADDFGPLVYNLPFSEAVKRGLLAPYRVVVQVKTHRDLARWISDRYRGSDPKPDIDALVQLIKEDKQAIEIEVGGERLRMMPSDLLCHIATSKFMAQHELSRAVVFHNTIYSSRKFSERHVKVVSLLAGKEMRQGIGDQQVVAKHISGNHSMHHREAVIENLDGLVDEAGRSIQAMLVCNSRCISEGTDVPALDMVVLADRHSSSEQLAQMIGRVMRKDPKNDTKTGYVLVPLLEDEAVLADQDLFAQSKSMKQVRAIIDALSIYDDLLATGQQEDAYWHGYRANTGAKDGIRPTTVRGSGAHAPYWRVRGSQVSSSWDQEPEINISLQPRDDNHATIDILATVIDKNQTIRRREAAIRRSQEIERQETASLVGAVSADVKLWAKAVDNRLVDVNIQKNRWWYNLGRVSGALSEVTGIE